ncbi:MAG: SDR family NAD(P)-dependent oxidoreductase [Bacillaceae bacterium]
MYKDKVVVITGAGNGIGLQLAKMYGSERATLVLIDRDIVALKNIAAQLMGQSNDVYTYGIDLQSVKDIVRTIEDIEEKLGTIHILINNAGLSRWFSPYDITEQQWDEVLDSNLKGTFFMARECAKVMKKHGGGRIVNIASTRAFMSEPNSEAYAASKGGIVALTHALAISLGSDNITVNCISPGWIETKDYEQLREVDHHQHPSQRVGTPADIGRACFFLTDAKNDFITGENITIDGGMTKKMIYIE